MKHPIAPLIIIAFILNGPCLLARSGPDNVLGIDPVRIDEMVKLVEPISTKWSQRFGRTLPLVKITHRFPVGMVDSGPIPWEDGPSGGMRYGEYVYVRGGGKTAQKRNETEWMRVYEITVENPVLEVIKPAGKSRHDLTLEEQFQGVTIDEIVRITYDVVIFFDNDISDGLAYRIVMPMDVTLFGEAGWRSREYDGCAGWRSEYRLLEASYGPLELIAVSFD